MTARILLETPITFETAGGQRTHAPLVLAEVNGVSTRLIVDTGSDVHLLTTELADRLGLAGTPGESGTDSAGASVQSVALGDVPVQVAEEEIVLRDVQAIPAPPPFVSGGIGGIVSPQLLHPGRWAVLDLAMHGFFLADGTQTDLTAWLTARHPGLRLLTLERAAGDGTILVQAAIEPFQPVVTMLDTGGKRTTFASSAVPGLATGSAPTVESGRGVSGTPSSGAEVLDQTILVDGVRVPLASLIVGAEMPGRSGLIGMDLLRGTVLAVSADPDQPVLWQLAKD